MASLQLRVNQPSFLIPPSFIARSRFAPTSERCKQSRYVGQSPVSTRRREHTKAAPPYIPLSLARFFASLWNATCTLTSPPLATSTPTNKVPHLATSLTEPAGRDGIHVLRFVLVALFCCYRAGFSRSAPTNTFWGKARLLETVAFTAMPTPALYAEQQETKVDTPSRRHSDSTTQPPWKNGHSSTTYARQLAKIE